MKVEGLILYNIELDGCLNGVYTNNHSKGKIYNEIAKKIDESSSLEGEYNCCYFESRGTEGIQSLLFIKRNLNKSYSFIWENSMKKKIFEGIGYQMNNTQIVVSYWSF